MSPSDIPNAAPEVRLELESTLGNVESLLFAADTVLHWAFDDPLPQKMHAPFNAVCTLLEKAREELRKAQDGVYG